MAWDASLCRSFKWRYSIAERGNLEWARSLQLREKSKPLSLLRSDLDSVEGTAGSRNCFIHFRGNSAVWLSSNSCCWYDNLASKLWECFLPFTGLWKMQHFILRCRNHNRLIKMIYPKEAANKQKYKPTTKHRKHHQSFTNLIQKETIVVSTFAGH